ncbi:MAG TPA: TetR/AcrR family transcriptional regulator [Pseudonocardia sp.]|nr:TetR/AcrR family transcriptional regulator [Pseudonocardia sp.]
MAQAGSDDPAPGTPGWWRARPAPPSQPRRGRPPRSFERIVAAAADLVDEVGTGTFSMRLLAERLSTSTATLYRHFAGKDELMVFVVDRLFAGAGDRPAGAGGSAGDPPQTWQDTARRASFGFRGLLSRHPNVLPLLVSQVPIGPNGLVARERMIATLVACGFEPRLAARAYTTIAHYVVGFAVQQHAPGAPGPEDAAVLGDFYRALDPVTYPYTVAASDALTAVSLDEEFAEGLEFILDGIERALSTDR